MTSKLDNYILEFFLEYKPDHYDEPAERLRNKVKALMLETYCKAQELSPVKEPVEFTDTFNELVENL